MTRSDFETILWFMGLKAKISFFSQNDFDPTEIIDEKTPCRSFYV
ncbi:hypothetical protein LEP1GSC062_0363 [Leptospira alexanderi serovar Manhao 3 str. L 60]|uniref:Uncharacterized protein n=1 Tax=Leptospira alexanderi serovar Manhao 3 str. L 60 TaxID=1049759 RepID=V6I3C9_9LEPT|nr:hypothetical protein LEP1GSC062_0363 [Leptospira alexanderi serovar Manhao 3 str. L 60]